MINPQKRKEKRSPFTHSFVGTQMTWKEQKWTSHTCESHPPNLTRAILPLCQCTHWHLHQRSTPTQTQTHLHDCTLKNPCCFGLIKNFKWNNTHTFSSFNLPSLSLSLSLSLLEEYPTLCLVPQKISHKQSQNKRKWLLMDKETHQEMPNAKRPHFFDVYSAIFSSQRLVFFFFNKKNSLFL